MKFFSKINFLNIHDKIPPIKTHEIATINIVVIVKILEYKNEKAKRNLFAC